MSIWFLEDNEIYAQIGRTLLEARFKVTTFTTLKALENELRSPTSKNPSLLVADLMLPDGDFLSFMSSQAWKDRPIHPFIVTSGVTDIESMRACLRHGSYDYITKPYAGSELQLKIEMALSDNRPAPIAPIEILGDRPILDHMLCRVNYRGRSSDQLTLREMHLFTALNDSFGKRLTKSEIVIRVWGETKVTVKAFDVHLAHLRAKIRSLDLEVNFSVDGGYALRETVHQPELQRQV